MKFGEPSTWPLKVSSELRVPSSEFRVQPQPLGQAEVGDPGLIRFVDDDVGRFEIAMEDAVPVSVMDRLGDGLDVPGRHSRRDGPVAHDLAQRPAGHVVHREERLTLVLAHLVNGYDVRVLQRGSGLGLGAEPTHELGPRERGADHHFEGDNAVQASLPGSVNHAHSPTGDFLQQLVVAEDRGHLRPERGDAASRLGGGAAGGSGWSTECRAKGAGRADA
jgi:hypothetical protein